MKDSFLKLEEKPLGKVQRNQAYNKLKTNHAPRNKMTQISSLYQIWGLERNL
jgi:hypothetical protein